MWVRLTQRRLEAIESHVPASLWDELCVEQREISRTVIDVRAPAIAWEFVKQILLDDVYNRLGQRRVALPRFMAQTAQVVTQALNAAERHPALRQVGMVGFQAEAFPVWTQPLDARERVFTIFPAAGNFQVLKPVWSIINGQRTTTWNVNGNSPDGDRLGEESTHLNVLRDPALVRVRVPHLRPRRGK